MLTLHAETLHTETVHTETVHAATAQLMQVVIVHANDAKTLQDKVHWVAVKRHRFTCTRACHFCKPSTIMYLQGSQHTITHTLLSLLHAQARMSRCALPWVSLPSVVVVCVCWPWMAAA